LIVNIDSIYSAIILKWHHQLKNILLIQDRLMNIEDQSTGIHEEIHFWQNCLSNLHNLHKQIQRKELQTIIRELNLSKSAYIQQFLQAEKEVRVRESFNWCNPIFLISNNQKFTEFVEDCLKFLKILSKSSLQLNDVSIEQLKTVIIDIFYRILIIWHHSKFLATPERIQLIIRKVNFHLKSSAYPNNNCSI